MKGNQYPAKHGLRDAGAAVVATAQLCPPAAASLDHNHLVGSGHGGVLDPMSDLAVRSLDFGTWCAHPPYYELSLDQLDRTIGQFCSIGARAGTPVLLEEFGYARSNPDDADAYAHWLDTLNRDPASAGWAVSRQDSGIYPLDLQDQSDVRNDGSPIWSALRTAAARGRARRRGPLRPRGAASRLDSQPYRSCRGDARTLGRAGAIVAGFALTAFAYAGTRLGGAVPAGGAGPAVRAAAEPAG